MMMPSADSRRRRISWGIIRRPSITIPASDSFELLGCLVGLGEDVVFLGQPVTGMHDAIGDIPVIREEQQALRVAVEPAHRKDALRH